MWLRSSNSQISGLLLPVCSFVLLSMQAAGALEPVAGGAGAKVSETAGAAEPVAGGVSAKVSETAGLALPAETKLSSESEKDQSSKGSDQAKSVKNKSLVGKSAHGKNKKKHKEFANVLPCMTWVDPDVEPRAVLLCVHGLGLHSDSYEDFGKRMSKLGYLVYAVDVPGFGSFQQAGKGRDRIDFKACIEGIAETLHFVHKVNPKLPVFLLGESMGGAIALRVCSMHPEAVSGLISSVPSGDRFNQGQETLRVGLKLLTAPNKEFDIGSSVIERATEDCELRKHWAEDPLNRMNLTPKELIRFQDFMNENHESARKITKTPVLFVQGCKDKLVRPEGTQELFNRIASPDRELKLIVDGEHLIFEVGQFNDEVIQMLDSWLTSRIVQNSHSGNKSAQSLSPGG